jgi:hypothetical protein
MRAEALLPLVAVLAVLAVLAVPKSRAPGITGNTACDWCDATEALCASICDALSDGYASVPLPGGLLNTAWLCAHASSLGGSALRLEITERNGEEMRGTAVVSYYGVEEARLTARVVGVLSGVLVFMYGGDGALKVGVVGQLSDGVLRGALLTPLQQLGHTQAPVVFTRV